MQGHHPHFHHPHLHYPHIDAQLHPHLHGLFHPHLHAGAHVGRVGVLAVAFGIGTAAAAGLPVSVANADTGDSSSSQGRGNSSTSQSVNVGARRGSSRSATQADAGQIDAPTTRRGAAGHATTAVAERGFSSDRPAAVQPAPELHLQLPSDAFAGPAPAPVADPVPVSQRSGTSPVGSAVAVDSAVTEVGGEGQAIAPVPQPQPMPVPSGAITSPPAASAALATTFSKVLDSLSDALSGNVPTVPADATLALMLGAARRDRIAALRGVATAAPVVAAATTTSTTTTTIEGEKFVLSPSGAGKVIADRTASSRYALAMLNNGTASTTVNLPASTAVVVRAKAQLNAGPPNLTLSIDGVPVTTVMVKSTGWQDYTFAGAIPAGTHQISIGYSNNYDTALGQRNLYIDKVTTVTGPIGDDFTGKAGSSPGSLWTTQTGSGWDTGIETYVSSNAVLDGQGHLAIKSTRNKNGTYSSGWVESKNKLSMGYGTTTARIKVPKGQGLWPAFWLKGADEDTTAWPASGEIDVMELPSTTTTMYSTLHGPISGTTATQQAQIVSNLPDLSTDYHNYWVRHLPNEITFGVDNITLGTLTPDSLPPGATWVYNRPMHVTLNMAVGGPWAGAPNNSTVFPATMLVDWVRFDPA